MARARFETCLDAVLVHEGGYADNPADPGGATNMGITRQTLARWRGVSPWWALAKAEVRAMGRAEAARIYHAHYWAACKGDQLPAGLDLAVFDFAVNSGPDRAIKTLQGVLEVKADGQIGPLTLGAIGTSSIAGLIGALCDRRLQFLRALRTFSTFGTGWTARVNAIRQAGLMAAPAKPLTQTGETSMAILDGYKTYIVAAIMLLVGLAQALGWALPAFDGGSSGQLILQALAVVFLRKGIKTDAGNA